MSPRYTTTFHEGATLPGTDAPLGEPGMVAGGAITAPLPRRHQTPKGGASTQIERRCHAVPRFDDSGPRFCDGLGCRAARYVVQRASRRRHCAGSFRTVTSLPVWGSPAEETLDGAIRTLDAAGARCDLIAAGACNVASPIGFWRRAPCGEDNRQWGAQVHRCDLPCVEGMAG